MHSTMISSHIFQLFNVVTYIHSGNCIHRDLKVNMTVVVVVVVVVVFVVVSCCSFYSPAISY